MLDSVISVHKGFVSCLRDGVDVEKHKVCSISLPMTIEISYESYYIWNLNTLNNSHVDYLFHPYLLTATFVYYSARAKYIHRLYEQMPLSIKYEIKFAETDKNYERIKFDSCKRTQAIASLKICSKSFALKLFYLAVLTSQKLVILSVF